MSQTCISSEFITSLNLQLRVVIFSFYCNKRHIGWKAWHREGLYRMVGEKLVYLLQHRSSETCSFCVLRDKVSCGYQKLGIHEGRLSIVSQMSPSQRSPLIGSGDLIVPQVITSSILFLKQMFSFFLLACYGGTNTIIAQTYLEQHIFFNLCKLYLWTKKITILCSFLPSFKHLTSFSLQSL